MSVYSSITLISAFWHRSADGNTEARARPSRNAFGYLKNVVFVNFSCGLYRGVLLNGGIKTFGEGP